MDLFTYGTLMFPDIWTHFVKQKYDFEDVFIHGFQRVFIQHDIYPVLRPSPFAKPVKGRIYLGIQSEDIKRLDFFEGPCYERRKVATFQLPQDKQSSRTADIYLLKPQFQFMASKRPWQPQTFETKFKPTFKRICIHHRRQA